MTIEEAIRLLDPETTGEAIEEIKYYGGFIGQTAAIHAISDATAIACEAMRKQIPKKPTITVHKYRVENSDELSTYHLTHCPCCFGNAEIKYFDSLVDSGTEYCRRCGQAVNWSNKEMPDLWPEVSDERSKTDNDFKMALHNKEKTESEKISSLESENAALRQLLKLAVDDIVDIHNNTEEDYVCSKCASFDVYTFCKRDWGERCQFKWRYSDKIDELLKGREMI